jgi:hypothetical protein
MKVKRSERGWAGHYICANKCRFRRNTLLECDEIRIVVSTVGLMDLKGDGSFEGVGADRHFETMAFHADPTDSRYHDADVEREVSFGSPWHINEVDADDRANDMHEAVVAEIAAGLEGGKIYKETPDA